MLGGYNIYGVGAYASKVYNNLPPYFRLRIWFRFYKIDSWDSENLYVSVNNVQKYSSIAFLFSDNMYTGDQCGWGFGDQSTMISLEYDEDSVLSIEVKLSSNLNTAATEESWGFSHFAISVLICNPTCKTCSNENANGCKTCYPHATKQADSTCSCDDTYYAVTASICSTSICTVCTSCFTGCRKCTSSANTDCQSCVTGFLLHIYMFLILFILPD
jgi:hypothetical protein